MKICGDCNIEKNVEDFFNATRNRDGKDGICKACRKERSREYNARNKERLREYEKQYKQKRYAGTKAKRYIGREFDHKAIAPKYKEKPKEKGYIYLIKDHTFTGYIKIGKTTSHSPTGRMNQIKGQMPVEPKLESLAHIRTDDMNNKETDLHTFFHDKRQVGEWFLLNEQDIEVAMMFLRGQIKISLKGEGNVRNPENFTA